MESLKVGAGRSVSFSNDKGRSFRRCRWGQLDLGFGARRWGVGMRELVMSLEGNLLGGGYLWR